MANLHILVSAVLMGKMMCVSFMGVAKQPRRVHSAGTGNRKRNHAQSDRKQEAIRIDGDYTL